MRTFLPILGRAFVSTYMYIFGREKFHNLLKDALEELESGFLTRAEYTVLNIPALAHFILLACTT
jgi:hypothetical protein